MAEALPIPDELVDLQRSLIAAQTKVEEYGRREDAERRTLFPAEDQWRAQIWPEEGPERAELTRLRAERDVLVKRIREHPVLVQARATGCRKETHFALQKKAGQPAAQQEQD